MQSSGKVFASFSPTYMSKTDLPKHAVKPFAHSTEGGHSSCCCPSPFSLDAITMAALVPIATEVGLGLLLQPASSSVVANAGCIAAGMVYPVYASCKALDGGSTPEKSHWLAYWVAFGGFSALEAFLTQRFPGYYHLKLLLLLWLQSKRHQGAWRLYIELVRPLYRKIRPQVDAALSRASSVLDNREVKSASQHLHNALGKVPIVEWFVREPADESSLERFFARLLG